MGCTVGQRVAGIRVVREEDGIRPPGWRRSGRRYALPRSAQTFGLISDSWEQRNDKRLGQCMHDRRAKTVVVQAQAPPAAAETGGLAALASPDSGSPAAHDHVRRWEKRERVRRIALGSAIGLLGAVVLVSPFVAGRLAAAEPSRGEPAFEVSTFYEDAARFEVRSGTRSATFERTAFKVLDDEKGCLAGATSEQVRNVLRENRCTGRIEVAFQTTEGVLVSSHILRFPNWAMPTRPSGACGTPTCASFRAARSILRGRPFRPVGQPGPLRRLHDRRVSAAAGRGVQGEERLRSDARPDRQHHPLALTQTRPKRVR